MHRTFALQALRSLGPIIAAAFVLTATSGPAQQLLSNPGFEGSFTTGVAPGWSNFPVDTRSSSTFAESAAARSGSKAQLFSNTRKLGGFFPGPMLSAPISGGVVLGHDYEARVWVRTDRRELQDVSLAVDSADWWQPQTYAFRRVVAGPIWTEIVLRFRAEKTDASANVAVRLGAEGNLWVDDASCREIPASESAPALEGGNALRNGSFEVGTAGWRAYLGSATTTSLAAAPGTDLAQIATWGRATAAAHGTHVLTFRKNGIEAARLESWPVTLPWKQSYTLSFCARAGAADTALRLDVRAGETIATLNATLGTNWSRQQLTFFLPPTPGEQVYLVLDLPGGGSVSLDAVMLEPGTAASSAFVARRTLEAGFELPSGNGALAPGQDFTPTLRIFNAGSTAASPQLRRRVRDVWENVVAGSEATWTQAMPPNTAVSVPLSFPGGSGTGIFRAEVDVDDALTGPTADATFARLPAAPAADHVAAFGTHLDYASSSDTLMRSAGAGWAKTWRLTWGSLESPEATPDASPTARLAPSAINQTAGYLGPWRNSGLKVLAILGNAPSHRQARPDGGGVVWKSYPPLNDAALADYVTKVATRFGGDVDVWEIENEPDHFLSGANGLSAVAAYARMCVTMIKALRAVRPDAKVLIGSATTDRRPQDWIIGTLSAQPELRNLVNGVSYHNYDADPATSRRNIREIRAALEAAGITDLEIWDTEWAPISNAGSFLREGPWLRDGLFASSARRVAALAVQGQVTRLGEGAANGFLYHGYGPPALNGPGYNLPYELDGRIHPLVVAHAVAAAQLRGATTPEPLAVTGGYAYRFLRPDGRQVVVAWADDLQLSPASLVAPFAVTATDFMGNPGAAYAAGAAVPLTGEPVYLLGPEGDLQVSYGGTVLFSGDAEPTVGRGTDFGRAEVDTAIGGVTRDFLVRNAGSSTLSLSAAPGVEITGAAARDFTVVTPLPATLAPGQTAPLRLRYQPLATGSGSATLRIPYTKAGGASSFFTQRLAGVGTATAGALTVSPSPDSASRTASDVDLVRPFTVINTGRAPLAWSATLPTNYTSIASGDPDGPIYSWSDLESLGATDITPPGLTDNSYVALSASIPFDAANPTTATFPFYGRRYASFRASTSGFISFGTNPFDSSAGMTGVFPATWPKPSIQVFGNDHFLQPGIGRILYRRLDHDTWAVTWLNVSKSNSRAQRMTFQVLLRRDGSILCQYQNVVGPSTIAVLDDSTSPTRYKLHSNSNTPPANNSAVLFLPPAAALSTTENYTPATTTQTGTSQWARLTGALSGNLSASANATFSLIYNPANLSPGLTYRTRLELTSDDPDRPTFFVPIALTVGSGAPSSPPAISLAAPVLSAAVAPANVTLTANASDADGSVASVEFLQNGQPVGVRFAPPYTLEVANVPAGAHVFSARARDDAGNISTSDLHLLDLPLADNAPATIDLQTLPATAYSIDGVTLRADASDTDGTILRVDYFANGGFIGSAYEAPYALPWPNPAAGTYAITAQAFDSGFRRTTSTVGNITILNSPPTVALTAPAAGASATAPATVVLEATASDSDGSIARVEFYRSGSLLGEATTAPYAFTWTNAPAGIHALTARAVDNSNNLTDSAPVNLVVHPTPPRAANLVAFWRLDESAGLSGLDLSGQNRALTRGGATRTSWLPADGKFGGSLDFAGASSGSDRARASFALSGNLTTFTFSAWVRVDSYSPTLYPRLLALPQAQVLLRNDGQAGVGLSYSTGTGNTLDWYGAASPPAGATWRHVAVTFTPATGPTFYLDGAPLTRFTVTPGTAFAITPDVAYLGNRGDDARALDGSLDHVRLYDAVLSAAEVATLANEDGSPGVPANLAAEPDAATIRLSWNAATGNVVTYQLSRATSAAGPFANLGNATAALTFADLTPAPATTYWYRVQAFANGVPGTPSGAVTAMPLSAHQAWRKSHFNVTEPVGSAADTADPDGDGRTNLLEYAVGSNPTSAVNSDGGPVIGLDANGRLTLTFRRTAPELTYVVEASSSLTPASWTPVPFTLNPVGMNSTAVDNTPGTARFLRLRVTSP